MTIAALGVSAGETVQNRGFGVLQIGQAQNGSGRGAFGFWA
jgi:hypothetical protein